MRLEGDFGLEVSLQEVTPSRLRPLRSAPPSTLPVSLPRRCRKAWASSGWWTPVSTRTRTTPCCPRRTKKLSNFFPSLLSLWWRILCFREKKNVFNKMKSNLALNPFRKWKFKTLTHQLEISPKTFVLNFSKYFLNSPLEPWNVTWSRKSADVKLFPCGRAFRGKAYWLIASPVKVCWPENLFIGLLANWIFHLTPFFALEMSTWCQPTQR